MYFFTTEVVELVYTLGLGSVRHEVSPFISVRSGISYVMLIFYFDMRLEQSKGMKLKGQCSHVFKRFEVKELEWNIHV